MIKGAIASIASLKRQSRSAASAHQGVRRTRFCKKTMLNAFAFDRLRSFAAGVNVVPPAPGRYRWEVLGRVVIVGHLPRRGQREGQRGGVIRQRPFRNPTGIESLPCRAVVTVQCLRSSRVKLFFC